MPGRLTTVTSTIYSKSGEDDEGKRGTRLYRAAWLRVESLPAVVEDDPADPGELQVVVVDDPSGVVIPAAAVHA